MTGRRPAFRTLRPNLELRILKGAALASAWCLAAAAAMPGGLAPAFLLAGAAAAASALPFLEGALARRSFEKRLSPRGRPWITIGELAAVTGAPGRREERWLGSGFIWEQRHTQMVSALLRTDWSSAFEKVFAAALEKDILRDRPSLRLLPLRLKSLVRERSLLIARRRGYPWIHALGEERGFFQPTADAAGHTLVIGTTGSGKSRVLDCLIVQEIARGGSVIVIDPKGDAEIERHMRAACRAFGRTGAFGMMHLARPEESIRINPLRNYGRVSELAPRLTSVVPASPSDTPFIKMAERDIRIICEAMKLVRMEPSIRLIRRYFLERESFAKRVMLSIAHPEEPPVSQALAKYTLEELRQQCLRLCAPGDADTLESLFRFGRQDMEFVMKTESVTLAALELLSSGSLARLLSPDAPGERLPDPRPGAAGTGITSFRDIIEGERVVYIGLDALADHAAAAAVGTLLLADLAAVAGAVYDHAEEKPRVSLFVDEASEVLSDTFIQLLNKGRGAGISITCATQAVADFTAKLGSRPAAWRVLANLNNLVALRCTDLETQSYVTERMPKTAVRTMSKSHSVSTGRDSPAASGGSTSERLTETEAGMVPPQLVNSLPDCEFFAVVSGGWVMKGRMPILVESGEEYRPQGGEP